jgi:hypothetical protein
VFLSGPLEGWVFRGNMKYVENIIQDFNVLMNDIAALSDSDYLLINDCIRSMLDLHLPETKSDEVSE